MADPFDDLRLELTPVSPRPTFVRTLRTLLEEELGMTTSEQTAASARAVGTTAPTRAARPAHVPPDGQGLTPYLAVRDSGEAIEFYADVMGAEVVGEPIIMPDGRVGHVELLISGSRMFMADEFPEMGVVGPETMGGTTTSFVCYVPDVDAAFARAEARGARVERPPADGQHGSRGGWLVDPFGHRWSLATPEGAPFGDAVPASELASERTPGEVGYLTFGSRDPAATGRFFAAVFGWDVQQGHDPDGLHVANTTPPAGIHRAAEPAPTLYLRVDEIREAVDRVRAAGGTAGEPERYESGWNSPCEDGNGVAFDLWEPAPDYR